VNNASMYVGENRSKICHNQVLGADLVDPLQENDPCDDAIDLWVISKEMTCTMAMHSFENLGEFSDIIYMCA
jgi:hypothetical protein